MWKCIFFPLPFPKEKKKECIFLIPSLAFSGQRFFSFDLSTMMASFTSSHLFSRSLLLLLALLLVYADPVTINTITITNTNANSNRNIELTHDAVHVAHETLSIVYFQAVPEPAEQEQPAAQAITSERLFDNTAATVTDFMVDQNLQNHNTQDYKAPQLSADKNLKLVLRRAASFQITMSLPTSVDEQSVTFALGNTDCATSVVKNTPSSNQKSVVFEITIPPTAPIGRYPLTSSITKSQQLGDIIVLFNPWSTTDTQVYMPTDSDRQEYLLRGDGRVWLGSVGMYS